MAKDIDEYVTKCIHCSETTKLQRTPNANIITTRDPWEQIEANIFLHKTKWYIVVIDYYSKYIEWSYLPSLTSTTIINCLEAIFSRHGISLILFTDNGGQLISPEMQQFAEEFDFKIKTRSPAFPQSNEQAESAVKIAKKLLD